MNLAVIATAKTPATVAIERVELGAFQRLGGPAAEMRAQAGGGVAQLLIQWAAGPQVVVGESHTGNITGLIKPISAR